jgi:hypothetical protein
MHIIRTGCATLALALALAAPAPARADLREQGCKHTVTSVPGTIQAILTPAYTNAAGVELGKVAREMEILMLEAGHCQALTQSFENRGKTSEAELAEWHSLNQWLYRLANFLGLNSRGDFSIDWRREYESFAEAYELAI